MSQVEHHGKDKHLDVAFTRRRFVTLAGATFASMVVGKLHAIAEVSPDGVPPASEVLVAPSDDSDRAVEAVRTLADALDDPTGEKLAAIVGAFGLVLYRYDPILIPQTSLVDLLPFGEGHQVKEYAEGSKTTDLWSSVTHMLADDLVADDSIVVRDQLVLGPTTLIPSEALPSDLAKLSLVSVHSPGKEGWDWRTWALCYANADLVEVRGIGYYSIET